MKIEIKITNTPFGNKKESYIASLEGELQIYIGGNLFFNNSGMLLIEFAISIEKWLKKVEEASFIDFVYETMDYDEPIFVMGYLESGSFEIDSIWKEKGFFKSIDAEELIAAFVDYLETLEKYLDKEFDIKLNDFYKL